MIGAGALGFLAGIVGTLISKDEGKAERYFDELYVRSETGLGAEVGSETGTLRPRKKEAAPAVSTFVQI